MEKYAVIDLETGKKEERFYLAVMGDIGFMSHCHEVDVNELLNVIEAVTTFLAKKLDITNENVLKMIFDTDEDLGGKGEKQKLIYIYENLDGLSHAKVRELLKEIIEEGE